MLSKAMSSLVARSVSGIAPTFVAQGCVGATRFFAVHAENVLYEKKGNGVAVITVNRPKQLNALNTQTCREIVAIMQELDKDDEVLAMAVTGSGEKAFAAGADIKEMQNKTYADVHNENFFADWEGVGKIRKPLIAAVNGYALGGGCELAMMCDIIIASDKAEFGQPEILLGVIPGMGGTQLLTKAVGRAKAMDLILTGRRMKADEAERAGLVARVVPHDQLQAEVMKVAEQVAKFSLPSLTAGKECVRRAWEISLAEGVLFERKVFHGLFGSKDRAEGMSAFVEKRTPKWEHK